MLRVNFGAKDTDKSVIPCTESLKRDSSIIIAIACLLCLLQGYDGGAVPPISLSQSCTKGFRNVSQPI